MGPRRLMPGSVFDDRYEIVRVVGQGAMGTVYEALDRRSGARCALKLMSKDLAHDPKFIARFQAESKVGQSISGPHVADVFDAGFSTQDPAQPYFAMELLRGQNLEHYLASHEGRPPLAVHLVRSILRAITSAHEASVVHRDLKPENLFLHETGDERSLPVLKVLDFGVAKIVRETTHGGTSPGLGAPLWTAPEQGKEGQVIRPSSDVWALGLLAYRLLAGKVFWRNAHAKGTAFDLAVEMLRENLPLASARSREIGAIDLGPDFDRWFVKAVHRDPARRFQTAGEAARDLEPILSAIEARANEAHALDPSDVPASSTMAAAALPSTSPAPASAPAETPPAGPAVRALLTGLLVFLVGAVLWFVFR